MLKRRVPLSCKISALAAAEGRRRTRHANENRDFGDPTQFFDGNGGVVESSYEIRIDFVWQWNLYVRCCWQGNRTKRLLEREVSNNNRRRKQSSV